MGLASVLIDRVCVSGRVSAREGARKREFCLWVFLQYSLRERECVCVVVDDGERVCVCCVLGCLVLLPYPCPLLKERITAGDVLFIHLNTRTSAFQKDDARV